MDIEAIFKFIAKNPPMALITGGLLFCLLGFFLKEAGLFIFGIILIAVGVGLHYMWLKR